MGQKLVSHSRNGAQHIQVFAVRDPQINAFAMPGGYIGVNSGLVVSTSTESELASVIAHEVGHVVLRHIARGMTEQSQGRGVLLASLVRSEEHTSELQSLMRNSYAVFCLKQKNK